MPTTVVRTEDWSGLIREAPTGKAWEMTAAITAEHELAHALVLSVLDGDVDCIEMEPDDPYMGSTFFRPESIPDRVTALLCDVAGFARERMIGPRTMGFCWPLAAFFTESPFSGDKDFFVQHGGNKKMLRACVEVLEPFFAEHEWFFAAFTPQVVENGRVSGYEMAHELERRARCR